MSWHQREEDPDADGIMDQDDSVEVVIGKKRIEGLPDVPVPRRFYITKEDLDCHGYSKGCPGCISVLRRTARQQHTDECRKRLEKDIKGTEKLKRAVQRETEFYAKVIEADDKKRRVEVEMREQGGMEVDAHDK